MLATEQKQSLGELKLNVLLLHSNPGDPDNLAETAQVGLLLFSQGAVHMRVPPLWPRLVALHGTHKALSLSAWH